jgi:hypothetical protein
MSDQAPPIVKDAEDLICELIDGGISARLLGGVAVALRCPAALPPSPLARSYSDLDVVVRRTSRRRLPAVLERLEFRGADRFNAMNGHVRQLYTSKDGVELDVFIEQFKMCHEIDLRNRLEIDDATLPLAELLLTKLQVAELTEKDVRDCVALLLDHELTDDDTGINVTRICEVTGTDWGWWRTVTENLGKVANTVGELGLTQAPAGEATETAQELSTRINESPKTLRWRARARVGDRMPWRQEPDEKRRQ